MHDLLRPIISAPQSATYKAGNMHDPHVLQGYRAIPHVLYEQFILFEAFAAIKGLF